MSLKKVAKKTTGSNKRSRRKKVQKKTVRTREKSRHSKYLTKDGDLKNELIGSSKKALHRPFHIGPAMFFAMPLKDHDKQSEQILVPLDDSLPILQKGTLLGLNSREDLNDDHSDD